MIVYGRNVIRELLKVNRNKIKKIYVLQNRKGIDEILNDIKCYEIKIDIIEENLMRKLTNTDKNQGIAAEIEDVRTLNLKEFLEKNKDADKLVICMLDEIEDTHNIGAIIRSCEIFGISGIILPQKRNAPLNETVYKVSSGAIFYLDIIEVNNLNYALRQLKNCGFWIYGFDINGNKFLNETEFDKKSVLVFGNENRGLRYLIKRNCDFLVKIKQKGKIDSLNVSNAAAIAFYEVMKQIENK
jgi:predicted rRNA methylase